MKHLLLTTIAAVVLVGCGNPEADSALLEAAYDGSIEAVKQHLANGADVNAKHIDGSTPLHFAATQGHNATHTSVPCLLSLHLSEQNVRFNGLRVAIFRGSDEVLLKRYHAVPQDHALFKSEVIPISDVHD